ncbi:MAG: PAS domain S-box protein [Candidatus Obscuribacterales bacterium]|nr:PAS domain S-box protein [Candidatus Obscuribacterales bacterium]
MANVKSPLVKKGILLLAVLFALEIAFVGVLFGLLRQAEFDAWREAHAKEVLNRTSRLVKAYYDTCMSIYMFVSARDFSISDKYEKATDETTEQLNVLEALVADDPDGLSRIKKVRASTDEGLGLLEELRPYLEEDESMDVSMLRIKIAMLLNKIIPQLEEFGYQQRQKTLHLPAEGASSRQKALFWLVAGLICNVIFGVVVCVLFFRDIAQRLDVLVDNANKMRESKPLNEPLQGFDEIAHLDAVFHEMAQALEEAVQKERAIIDNSVDIICSLDPANHFTFVSSSVKQRWGYLPATLMSKPAARIIEPDSVAQFEKEIATLRAAKEPATFEIKVVADDKSMIDTSWSGSWSENLQALFFVIHDVTERKRIERMKEEFVAMVGHDMRTPLTSIIGVLTTVAEGRYGEITPKGRESLRSTERIANRLVNLVNDILDAEKLQSGTFEVFPEHLPLSPIIRASVDTIKDMAQVVGVAIEYSYTDIDVFVDEERLEQVLVNLLSNAVKFSPNGSAVRISAEAKGDHVEISVSDSGKGIALQDQTLIFRPFRQVSPTDQKVGRGIGLGLPICKKLIELMGGTIGVDSEINKGARFWVKVPKGNCEDDELVGANKGGISK